jgi:hypothetical protein
MMRRYKEGVDRGPPACCRLPGRLRAVDAYVDELDLVGGPGFCADGDEPAYGGPAGLPAGGAAEAFLYGCLNRVRSRGVEKECVSATWT